MGEIFNELKQKDLGFNDNKTKESLEKTYGTVYRELEAIKKLIKMRKGGIYKRKPMIEYGYARSIKEFAITPLIVFVYFMILSQIVNAFSNIASFLSLYFNLFKLLYILGTLIGNIIIVEKIKYWSTEYLLGYLLGLVLLAIFILPQYLKFGFIDILDLIFVIVYFIVGIYILIS